MRFPRIRKKWMALLLVLVPAGLMMLAFQHRLEYQSIPINETVTLEDPDTGQPVQFVLHEIRVERFTDEVTLDFDNTPWYFKMSKYIPHSLVVTFARIDHLFSLPHQFDEARVEVSGIFMGDHELFRKFDITMRLASGWIAGSGAQIGSNNNNYGYFAYYGRVPVSHLNLSSVELNFYQPGSSDPVLIKTIDPRNQFRQVIYDFIQSKPDRSLRKMQHRATFFYMDEPNQMSSYIHPDVQNSFPRDRLPASEQIKSISWAIPYPEGNYLGFDNVYKIQIRINPGDENHVGQKQDVYLVKHEDEWKIIDVSPLYE
ncbi:MAG: hypothetical protein H0Z33_06915 [Bacillaceae bacterium]|nr:hypothetical protein [Bacillaceae bacterium]